MNSTAWAISSGCPRRFSGTGAVSFSSTSGRIEARMSVWVKPGAMEPTRIPKRASSFAHTTPKDSTPALAAL
jgi:hypothetical protein